MNAYQDVSYNFKKKKVLILEKSAPQNSIQGSEEQKGKHENGVGNCMLDKGHQAIQEKKVLPKIKPNRNKPKKSQLEPPKKPQKFYKRRKSSCTGEGKQATPLRIINNQFDSFEANLLNAAEDKSVNESKENMKLVDKNQQDDTQLIECTDNKMGPMKSKHEEGEANIPMSEECVATMQDIPLNVEMYNGNPYFDFIMKSENSTSHLHVDETAKAFHKDNIASEGGKEMDKRDKGRDKNGEDIFGNHLTAKDRNKIKVVCPHCSKKVSAPGFTRHLCYCMRGSLRKSARR